MPLTAFLSGRGRGLVGRFVLCGALLGLAVGVIEAALLFYIPWVPTLLETDVSYVIWLLAPLIDLTLFALLGALAGVMGALGKDPGPGRQAIWAAALMGIAGAHLGWLSSLIHVWVADQQVISRLATPAAWFASVFAAALLIAALFRNYAVRVFAREAAWPVAVLSKSVLAVAALLILGLGLHLARHHDFFPSARASAPVSAARPNIVLISLDTVRADHVSSYGYSRPTTPHLDRLASRGVTFENAISPTSWTLASHASMLTGLLPHQHGASNFTPLNTGPRTAAEVLRTHGYETASFNANGYGLAGWGLMQGFEVYDDNSSLLRHNLASMLVGRVAVWPLYLRLVRPDFYFRREAREVNSEVEHWLHHRSNRPYFIFVNYFDAHDPYFAPPPFDKRFGQVSASAMRRVSFGPGLPLQAPLTAEEKESLIAGYDNSLAFLDEQLGTLLRSLAASPDWDNTIVIVTSDHGEAFDEHGQYLHGRTLYRELLHVPLVFAGPGIPAGRRIPHLVRTRELFATVLDLALENSVPFQRSSLRRFWTPGFQPGPRDNWAISELVPFRPDFRPVMVSLVTPQWQYLHDSTGRAELYDLAADPKELFNLAGDPNHAPTLEKLHRLVESNLELSHRPWRGPDYLLALDRPGYSFLRTALFDRLPVPAASPQAFRVGTAQAFFDPDPAATPKPRPADADLVNSLPYH